MMWEVAPVDAAGLRSRVQNRLDVFLAEQRDVLTQASPDLLPLVDAAAELLSGGKRLRPAFCYWGYRGAGGADSDEVVAAATSLELFQAAALMHDDVMDDSDTRRGRPAVHRHFAQLHEKAGWSGSADRFGQAAAILLGDLALGWSGELFFRCGLPEQAVTRARPMLDLMRTQLMGGQYLDVLEQARGGGSVESARRVIHYKSAKYSVEHPLLIGGLLAGASEHLLDSYRAYGLPLGEAFQLRDDVLGVFGDPDQTGKPAGDDLREGKRTVLVAQAAESATPSQRNVLGRLGDPDLDEESVRRIRAVIVDTGALAAIERRITLLVDEAGTAIADAEVAPHARTILEGLIAAATARAA